MAGMRGLEVGYDVHMDAFVARYDIFETKKKTMCAVSSVLLQVMPQSPFVTVTLQGINFVSTLKWLTSL